MFLTPLLMYCARMNGTLTQAATAKVGDLLRGWRERRRLTQLEFAGHAEISTNPHAVAAT